jgi:Carboxypeptidase regulatory-like domain/TonB dependent receptor
MRTKIVRVLCLLSACSLLLWGQAISTSQIKGTVQDASGSAVPDAQVKATQTATGISRTVTTAADGSYLFSELPIGPYQIEVTKAGFSKYVQTGVTLQVNSNPTIDVALKVGAVTEQVLVEASAAMVETENAGVGQVIDQQRVEDLPLNGRQVTDLLYLTGGTSEGRAFRGSYPTQASPSIAGGMAGSVSYWLDGGTNNDPLSNQNLPLPFPDALQEFKVETSSLPAQYGVHPAGAVNAITKSGTNAIHGDLFEYVRNYIFDARTTGYADATNPRDNLKRNQFGGTVGGPIIKDKLFFFFGYQDTIERFSSPEQTTGLPTPAMLQGNFSGCGTLDPGIGSNDKVSPSTFSPIALKIAATLPVLSNASCGTYNYLSPTNYTESQGVTKIDYHLSDKNSIFGRYFVSNLSQQPGPASGNFILASVPGAADQAQNLTLGDTYLVTPRTVNSFRATFNRTSNTTVNNVLSDWTAYGVTDIYQLNPTKFGQGLGGLDLTGGPFGLGTTPSWQPYDTLEFSDDVHMSRGKHEITIGADFINLRAFATNYLNSNGNFSFDGSQTGIIQSDFLLGKPVSFTQSAPSYSDQHQNVLGVYVQDEWKVARTFTVNVGLRWDPFFAHTNPYGENVSFSLYNFENNIFSKKLTNAPPGFVTSGDPNGPTGNAYTSNKLNNWGPRLGLVWDPKGDGKMTIRAGFGIFYDFPNFSYDQFGFEEPFGGSVTVPTPSLSDPWAKYPGGNPFPNDVGTGKNAVYQQYPLVFGYPQKTSPTSIYQYNLTIQRQVGQNWLLSASYVGNQQRHLWINEEANPALYEPSVCPAFYCFAATDNERRLFNVLNPKYGQYFGETILLNEGGTGNYNGLILGATHRFASHFTSSSNFTWQHCISDNYTTALGLSIVEDMIPSNVPGAVHADRGNCPNSDTRLVFSQTLLVDSPKYSNHVVQTIAGNWRLSVGAIAQSGSDISLNDLVDFEGDGAGYEQRPEQILSNPYCHPQTVNCWINPAAFASPFTGVPAPGTFGNLGNNSLVGPGSVVINVALIRSFQIREHQTLEIRGEAFNVGNFVNLYPPQTSVIVPGFGASTPSSAYATGAGLGAFSSTVYDPRIMQFAMKYVF